MGACPGEEATAAERSSRPPIQQRTTHPLGCAMETREKVEFSLKTRSVGAPPWQTREKKHGPGDVAEQASDG